MKSTIRGSIRAAIMGVTVGIAVAAVSIAAIAVSRPTQAAGTDTIVNIEAHANGAGDQFVVVRPVDWAQPVYGIWVPSTCATELSIGDAWPTSNPAC